MDNRVRNTAFQQSTVRSVAEQKTGPIIVVTALQDTGITVIQSACHSQHHNSIETVLKTNCGKFMLVRLTFLTRQYRVVDKKNNKNSSSSRGRINIYDCKHLNYVNT